MKIYIGIITTIIILMIGKNVEAQVPEEYFNIAGESNPELQSKYKAFQASLQEVAQAQSLPDPTLSAGIFILPVETRVGPQRARFSLSQMFPWFGALKAKGDAAALQAEAEYQAYLDARNELFYNVAAAYFPLYEINRKQQLEEENIRLLKSYMTIATRMFENGTGSMTDALRADILLKEAVTTLNILNSKESELLARFNLLLNRSKEEAVLIPDSLFVEEVHSGSETDTLFSGNPLLKELEYKIAASEAQENAALKEGMPSLGVGLDYVIVGKREVESLPDNGKDVLMPMVSISIPVFRDKYKAAVKEAELMQESYALQKEGVKNMLNAQYETIWFKLKQNHALITLYEDQIDESERVLNLLFSTYSNSGRDFEELLRVQQQLLTYEKQKATAIADYFTTLAELNYLTAKQE